MTNIKSENSEEDLGKTHRFCPEKHPCDVALGPLLPSLRNINLQNDLLIMVLIALCRA